MMYSGVSSLVEYVHMRENGELHERHIFSPNPEN